LECDGFNIANAGWSCGGSATVDFLYDKGSGQLVSAIELGDGAHAGQQTCLAGSTSMAPVALPLAHCTLHQCFPNDSGIDSGTCNLDGGVAE
jgi:hypothetical protein